MATDVVNFLRNSKKGELKYDRYWKEEGRTEAVLEEISAHITHLSLIKSDLELSLNSEGNESSDSENQPLPLKVPKKRKSSSFGKENLPDLCTLSAISEAELPIIEYEKERSRFVQQRIEKKRAEVDDRLWELTQQIEQQYQLLKRKCELEIMRRNAEVQCLQEMNFKEAQEKEMKEKELHHTHAKRISARIKEAEMRQRQAEEELLKREREQEEMRLYLIACQRELHNCIQQTTEKLDMCAHKLHLEVTSDERHSQMINILQKIDNIVEESCYKGVEMEKLEEAQTLLGDAQMIYQSVTADTEQARNKGLLESEFSKAKVDMTEPTHSAKRADLRSPVRTRVADVRRMLDFNDSVAQNTEEGSRRKTSLETGTLKFSNTNKLSQNEITSVNHRHHLPGTSSIAVEQPGNGNVMQASNMCESTMKLTHEGKPKKSSQEVEELSVLYTFVARDAFDEYTKIMDFLDHWTNTCKPFVSDSKNKSYQFNLMKAVNTPINIISGKSGSHVKDKLERILAFLNGNVVRVSEKRITCKEHPLSAQYSESLVAQQFVKQGGGQVASNFSTVFPIAAVIVGVWTHYPNFGMLLLAHFYKYCPYLVPYYPPRQKGQTEVDYYKSLGYLYFDDSVEKQDKFLKRMSGFMRLYAAIIQSPIPPGCKGPHPHGIEWGWKWLSRILNLNPRPDITATLLYDFLEVLGNALQKSYGKQFQKLLHALCKDYFKKIQEVTPPGSGGPLSRLNDFLQRAIKIRHIALADGTLPSDFFRT